MMMMAPEFSPLAHGADVKLNLQETDYDQFLADEVRDTRNPIVCYGNCLAHVVCGDWRV